VGRVQRKGTSEGHGRERDGKRRKAKPNALVFCVSILWNHVESIKVCTDIKTKHSPSMGSIQQRLAQTNTYKD
jgi:hypothetical protein